MGNFSSTPVFKLFQRGLTTRTIKRFRGLNAYAPLSQLGPEWAQDILNVIIGANGQPSKMRQPVVVTGGAAAAAGPQVFFDFQQANGTRQIFANIGNVLAYYTGDGTNGPFQVGAAAFPGPWSFAEVSNILIGANGTQVKKWTGTDLLNVGIAIPTVAPVFLGTLAGNLSPTFGYEWAYSWKGSGAAPALAGPAPVEVSTASPATAQIGGGVVNKEFQLQAANIPPPGDPQFDTLVWYRTKDGGGDLFRLAEVNINTGVVTFNGATVMSVGPAPFLVITDNTPDTALDLTTRAPFLNNPPIPGKYVAVGQGRVVIMNLVGAPQDAIYSGYERILIGNPPECFPPNNRLRLAIGAEQIAGGGILQAGVVLFSNTDKMYMLRGQMEDITDTAPVQFTQYLEELPWTLGCLSHLTIKATPYGLVWLAGDKTVNLFDGHSQPIDLSGPVTPILRNITPGFESTCTAAYFNWLERDWYVLLVPYGGSITPNRMLMWGLDTQTQQIDIMVSTISADGIGVITTSKLQRQLMIGRNSLLYNLPVGIDTTGGIGDLSIYPAQPNSPLNAYYRTGYFGNDEPQRSEMWRWARLVTDQGGFLGQVRLVDDETRTLVQPEIFQGLSFAGRLSINRRAKRCSIEIDFPPDDVSANVQELQVASVPSSDR